MTGKNSNPPADADLEPIRLIEAEVAIDLLERYRLAANVGSVELAKHISIEAARVDSVHGFRISKSMIDSWRAGKSVPGPNHLPTLQIFFRSRRFLKVVPNVNYLWDALRATTDLGLQLLMWEEAEANGSTSEFDGFWIACDTEFEPKGDTGRCFRFASVSGYSFSVAHFVPTFVTNSPAILESPHSGFLFKRKDDYLLVLRKRANRKEEMRGLVRKIPSRKIGAGYQLLVTPLENTLSVGLRLKDTVPLVTAETTQEFAEIRKLFDSILWSVLPND